MSRRVPNPAVAVIVFLVGWAGVLALSAWSGRETPLPARAAEAPRWVVVKVPTGAAAARDWTHFMACSGLAGDPALMRATLLLNGGGDEAVWRKPGQREVPVRLALSPNAGALNPMGEKIISDAPGAVADCGETP